MSSAPERASDYERYPTGASARRAGESPEAYEPGTYESSSGGATALAAWLLMLGGVWSFLIGLAIVVKKAYFTSLSGYSSAAHTYAYHWNLTSWGWANLILGAVVVAAGACVLLGQTWARVVGITLAVISALGTFLFLPFFPLSSIIVIAIDLFIIWALATSGRRQDA